MQIKAGKDVSAISAHLWLEKTAFFKVPRSLQDETVEINGRAFEDVSLAYSAIHAFNPFTYCVLTVRTASPSIPKLA